MIRSQTDISYIAVETADAAGTGWSETAIWSAQYNLTPTTSVVSPLPVTEESPPDEVDQ
jgi:hypothetical protein